MDQIGKFLARVEEGAVFGGLPLGLEMQIWKRSLCFAVRDTSILSTGRGQSPGEAWTCAPTSRQGWEGL